MGGGISSVRLPSCARLWPYSNGGGGLQAAITSLVSLRFMSLDLLSLSSIIEAARVVVLVQGRLMA